VPGACTQGTSGADPLGQRAEALDQVGRAGHDQLVATMDLGAGTGVREVLSGPLHTNDGNAVRRPQPRLRERLVVGLLGCVGPRDREPVVELDLVDHRARHHVRDPLSHRALDVDDLGRADPIQDLAVPPVSAPTDVNAAGRTTGPPDSSARETGSVNSTAPTVTTTRNAAGTRRTGCDSLRSMQLLRLARIGSVTAIRQSHLSRARRIGPTWWHSESASRVPRPRSVHVRRRTLGPRA
jgi:hypothetical protein